MSAMVRTTSWVVATLLLTGLSLTAQTREPAIQARDALNKGVAAFGNANYEAAIEFFRQALEIDPELNVAELYLATAYSQRFVPGIQTRENLASAENAIESFKRVLKQDPENANALLGLASIYQTKNDFQNARETFLSASKLVPQNPVPFYSVAAIDWLLVYDRKNPLPPGEQARLIEEGLDNLDSALALNPQYDDAMTYKSLLFREKARLAIEPAERIRFLALADDWFNKALETRKRNAQIGRGAGATPVAPLLPPPPPPSR
jgi:tetratricopeptide (TPR) repeat protein